MKTFINVLYRRILYKIPLKLLLILLAIFGILFASFSSAFYNEQYAGVSLSLNGNQSVGQYKGVSDYYGKTTFCMMNRSTPVCNFTATADSNGESVSISLAREIGCLTGIVINSDYGITIKNNSSSSCTAMGAILFDAGNLVPPLSSLQCQTTYSLIPIDSVDQEYCTINNLCPSSGTPSDCPNIGVSNLFINDLFHPGAFNIIMNIPEEIDRDYAYTNSGQYMNIDIFGYNVDYQAIEDKVIIQNYKPNSSDLSKIISSIIPLFVPGLCIILLLYFIFKFIKKVF